MDVLAWWRSFRQPSQHDQVRPLTRKQAERTLRAAGLSRVESRRRVAEARRKSS